MMDGRKLRLCVTLLVLNLAFIWGNSLLPGEASAALSEWVRRLLSVFFQGGTSSGGGLLRKLAHFTEFALLGMCLQWLYLLLRTPAQKAMLFALGWGAAAACVDEIIQCFVPGRGPGLKDVGIDTLGTVLGIVIISLIQLIKNKNLEENNV